jgi:mono/diheme cytochrome c family protein
MRYRFHAVAGVAVLTAAAACGGGETQQQPPAETPPATPPAEQGAGAAVTLPPGVTTAMVTEGQTLFQTTGLCFTCHGLDAKGTANAPDLTDDTWLNVTSRNYDEIVGVITNGVAQPKQFPTPMVPKGGSTITDEQIRAVAAYVFSLGTH